MTAGSEAAARTVRRPAADIRCSRASAGHDGRNDEAGSRNIAIALLRGMKSCPHMMKDGCI